MADGTKSVVSRADTAVAEPMSIVVAVAQALRSDILARQEAGVLLGSEEELAVRYGVSRPTFRQAARLLEYEELLIARRGKRGGYFSRTPRAEVVARIAGVYLLAKQTPYESILRAEAATQREALEQIIANRDPDVRGSLLAFLESDPDLQNPSDIDRALHAVNRFWTLVGDLAGNEALALFLQVSRAYAYGTRATGLSMTAPRVASYIAALRSMAVAIKQGDSEASLRLLNERIELVLGWISADKSAPKPPRAKPRVSAKT
jgi:GntR family transcriptional repressor for pyruvate dehydrogenase complex